MKVTITMKDGVSLGDIEFRNGKNLIGIIRKNALDKYFFESFGFLDCDLSLLKCEASAKGFFRRKFKELGFDEVEFVWKSED